MKPETIAVAAVVAAVLLLLALAPWPYGYYQFLRVAICGIGTLCGMHFIGQRETGRTIAIAMFGMAAIFNPFLPVHLNRELWSVFNIGGVILFAFTAWKVNAGAGAGNSKT